jgi:outer membrane protein assembly factor BamD
MYKSNRFVRMVPKLSAVVLIGGISACTIVEEPDYVERPVADIYNNAMDLLQNTDFKRAAAEFDEVERQHPYSVWATKAQLMAAYAYYQSNRYDDAPFHAIASGTPRCRVRVLSHRAQLL